MKTESEVVQYFELDLLATVHKLHKRPIAWQEMFDSTSDPTKTVILDLWQEGVMPQSLYYTTAAGYDVLFSACWYLDHLDEDWQDFHKCNPRSGFVNLSAIQQAHILGGHASMWAEHVNSTNFFERVWPRTSAMAEALWSSNASYHGELAYNLVQGRLEGFRCWMIQQFDIPVKPIGPGYCKHEIWVPTVPLFGQSVCTSLSCQVAVVASFILAVVYVVTLKVRRAQVGPAYSLAETELNLEMMSPDHEFVHGPEDCEVSYD